MGDAKSDDEIPDPDFKVILLGDSAVGKSKLVERYLMDDYNPRQLSTYALTLFRKEILLGDDKKMSTIGVSVQSAWKTHACTFGVTFLCSFYLSYV